MQSTRSRGLIIGLAALTVLLGIWMFAGNHVYAETEPAAQSGATLTTENPSQAEQPKQGWQDDGTYYRDGVMLTGLQNLCSILMKKFWITLMDPGSTSWMNTIS